VLVKSGLSIEEMAILGYEELLWPLRDKLKMLIGGSAKDAHCRTIDSELGMWVGEKQCILKISR
jgi:hypothetical protein